MAWVKLDDAMPTNPKVMAAGPQAFALDVAGLCYSNRHGTDGFIPETALLAIYPALPNPKKWAGRLVEVGRWLPVDGGWQVHDILDYQPPAAEVEADRAKARERMRRLRAERSGNVRANTSDGSGEVRNPRPVPSRPEHDVRTSIVENLSDRAQHLARMFVGGRPSANDINGAARAIQAHPWLAELEDGELSMVLAKAKQSGTRFPSGLASVAGDFKPVKPLPKWCGACDETSRMVEVGDGFGNCPACHPGGAR